jgi:hypothetical protein
MGLITPKYEKPVFRYCVFPSVSNERYTMDEIMKWYEPFELQDDIVLLERSEKDGRKRQEYVNWLAREEDRINAGRQQMIDEDRQSLIFNRSADAAGRDFEVILGKPRFKDFILSASLPGKYEYLKDDIPTLDSGCGVHNEDEVADIVEEMGRAAEAAQQAKRELAKKLAEERRQREEEIRIQREKEEIDQRIRDNQIRLKKIRSHLEDLKIQRVVEAELKISAEIEARAEKERKLQEEELQRQRKAIHDAELAQIENDKKLMQIEDDYALLIRQKRWEFAHMEHEDILGVMRQVAEKHFLMRQRERTKELEEFYTPYEPFRFKKSKILVPHAHIDAMDYIVDDTLENNDDNYNLTEWIKMSGLSALGDDNHSGNEYQFQRDNSNSPTAKRSEMPIPSEDEIAPPLVWSGPTPMTKRYEKLVKKERLYTPLHPDKRALTEHIDIVPNEVVFAHTLPDKALSEIGLPKSIVRTISRKSDKRNKGNPIYFDDENMSEIETRRTHSPEHLVLPPIITSDLDKLGNAQKSSSTSQIDSFKSPLVYQTRADILCIDPSDELSSDKIRPMAFTVNLSKSRGTADSVNSSNKKIKKLSKSQSSDRVLQDAKDLAMMASLRSLMNEKVRDRKDSKEVNSNIRESSNKGHKSTVATIRNNAMENIRTQRTALHNFITSSAITEDKFYREACRPGIRSRDYISATKQDSILDIINGGRQDEINMLMFDVGIAENSSVAYEFYKDEINNAVVGESQSLERLHDSMSTSIDHEQSNDEVMHTVNDSGNKVIELPTERENSIRMPDLRQHNTPMPFSRKTFGVVGGSKPVTEPSPAALANKLQQENEKFETILEGVHKTTAASRQKKYLATLKLNAMENKKLSYDASSPNFLNSTK